MSDARLLTGIGSSPMTYERHRAIHGEPCRPRPGELAAELERSGLRGRGGGGFPLATKLAAVRRGRGAPVLVINGAEGEPMSTKDRLLLWCAPHLVLDGATALADAAGAGEVIVAIDELEPRIHESLAHAIEQRSESRRLSTTIVAIPSGYITGQESALVRWINDGVALPSSNSARVTERGVDGRPTLVANAETVAHVALISRHGAQWFRQRGLADDPGTALITLSGAVREPGVYEIGQGTSLTALLDRAGGTVGPVRAYLIGGYAGAWVDAADAPEIRLSRAELAAFGARLGAGIVVALEADACPVAETARIARWLAAQSAGQCGPCVNGLGSIADAMAAIRDGGDPRTLQRVQRWCELVTGRGACAHPDGAASFIASALRVFADELIDHARLGRCEACDSPAVLTRTAAHALRR
jgi:NADH:ubiquinone oxidoreductase subunit F (NADH-binding)